MNKLELTGAVSKICPGFLSADTGPKSMTRVSRGSFLTRPFNLLCVPVARYQLAQLIKVTCYAFDVSVSVFGKWVGDVSLG
jgi:hypothetical protein